MRKFSDKTAENIIAPSQGIHLVFDRKFLPDETALMVPKTSDERVLFAIPWHDHAVFGTTDTPLENPNLSRTRTKTKSNSSSKPRKLSRKLPRREDILSVFVGIRPLVKAENAQNTATLARDHTIEINKANLLTITGGKWTTYRRMAEDTINQAAKLANLPEKKCLTENLKIHGAGESQEAENDLSIYGSDAEKIEQLIKENPALGENFTPNCLIEKPKLFGRFATRWRKRSKIFSPAGHALCF